MSGSGSPPDGASTLTWNLCPLSSAQITAVVSGLVSYSLVYLIYAQHHAVLFYFMTGLVAVFMVSLYTTGLLAVIYTMFKVSDLDKEVESRHCSSAAATSDIERTVVEMKF